MLVQVVAQALKHDDHMLSESEAVNQFDDLVASFVVCCVSFLDSLQHSDLYVCVVHVEFLVFADLDGHLATVLVFHVATTDHGSEGTSVDCIENFVPVAQLLTFDDFIVAVFVGQLVLVFSSYLANCVNSFKLPEVYLDSLELCKLFVKSADGFLRAKTDRVAVSHCTLAA